MKRREFIASAAFCAVLPAVPGIAQTTELTQARVGGPPDDWHKVEVCFDGKWSGDWIEVDADKGWGFRYAKDAEGQLIVEDAEYKREMMTGDFSLSYKES